MFYTESNLIQSRCFKNETGNPVFENRSISHGSSGNRCRYFCGAAAVAVCRRTLAGMGISAICLSDCPVWHSRCLFYCFIPVHEALELYCPQHRFLGTIRESIEEHQILRPYHRRPL